MYTVEKCPSDLKYIKKLLNQSQIIKKTELNKQPIGTYVTLYQYVKKKNRENQYFLQKRFVNVKHTIINIVKKTP